MSGCNFRRIAVNTLFVLSLLTSDLGGGGVFILVSMIRRK